MKLVVNSGRPGLHDIFICLVNDLETYEFVPQSGEIIIYDIDCDNDEQYVYLICSFINSMGICGLVYKNKYTTSLQEARDGLDKLSKFSQLVAVRILPEKLYRKGNDILTWACIRNGSIGSWYDTGMHTDEPVIAVSRHYPAHVER